MRKIKDDINDMILTIGKYPKLEESIDLWLKEKYNISNQNEFVKKLFGDKKFLKEILDFFNKEKMKYVQKY